jgi:hypothetical protein
VLEADTGFTEGRRKKEEGRKKKEEGRRKKDSFLGSAWERRSRGRASI